MADKENDATESGTDELKVTVVLCTYNRCRSLAKTLESVAQSIVPESVQWEVLVVDNNSRDQTREVVEDFSSRYPGRFRYHFEPRQGKSHALNAGIREAQGEVLAFTDDDVTVESTWLQHLTANLLPSGWVGSGGRILPDRSFTEPSWFPFEQRYANAPLAMFDLGPDPEDLLKRPLAQTWHF